MGRADLARAGPRPAFVPDHRASVWVGAGRGRAPAGWLPGPADRLGGRRRRGPAAHRRRALPVVLAQPIPLPVAVQRAGPAGSDYHLGREPAGRGRPAVAEPGTDALLSALRAAQGAAGDLYGQLPGRKARAPGDDPHAHWTAAPAPAALPGPPAADVGVFAGPAGLAAGPGRGPVVFQHLSVHALCDHRAAALRGRGPGDVCARCLCRLPGLRSHPGAGGDLAGSLVGPARKCLPDRAVAARFCQRGAVRHWRGAGAPYTLHSGRAYRLCHGRDRRGVGDDRGPGTDPGPVGPRRPRAARGDACPVGFCLPAGSGPVGDARLAEPDHRRRHAQVDPPDRRHLAPGQLRGQLDAGLLRDDRAAAASILGGEARAFCRGPHLPVRGSATSPPPRRTAGEGRPPP